MRLDRFITLNVIEPFRRAAARLGFLDGKSMTLPVPILMYHGISDDPEPGVSPYHKTHTSPAVFRQHMQFLAAAGYRTLSLDQLVKWLNPSLTRSGDPSLPLDGRGIKGEGNQPPTTNPPIQEFRNPARLVCITFDDGFRDFYTKAFLVLRQCGFTATVFLPTAFIGDPRRRFSPRRGSTPSPANTHPSDTMECLTWGEVRELRQCGIRFGSHTVNHPRLVELGWSDVERELRDSKTEMEQQLGEPITAFAHPFAFPQADRQYVHGFGELLAAVGYTCCTTTEVGRAQPGDDLYRLKRLPINGLDDRDFFRAKLEGGYDWLGGPQALVKKAKQTIAGSRRRESLPVKLVTDATN